LALLSAIGVLYSGYLSFISLASGHPACETFYLGLPSCFYGLVIYAAILVTSVATLFAIRNVRTGALVLISIGGVAFSGYLTWIVMVAISCTTLEIFGLPPCVYGLGMFALVLIITASLIRGHPQTTTG
jgi:uncharacterized membrane protein